MANRTCSKGRRYWGFIHPILTFEYHCFGYRQAGHTKDTISDGYETTITATDDTHLRAETKEKTHIERYAYFKRHEEYPKNALFVLLELLMTIISIIRVQISKFLILGCILCYILSTALEIDLQNVANILGGVAIGVYAASFIIPLLGFAVRKGFKLDEKIDAICEENKWKKWSEYKDENTRR